MSPRRGDDGLSDPSTKNGRLQRALLDLLKEHKRDGAIPTNGRFLFYELEQRGLIPKHYAPGKKRTPAQDVTYALTVLRETGLVPWNWITDETREVSDWQCAGSVFQYAMDAARSARISPWGDDEPPLLICEARSVKAVLEDLASEYLVPITATGGQCGGFLVTDVAPLLYGTRRVAYIGDFELRGPADQIEANTKRVLEHHSARDFDDECAWERIALTEKQVNASKRLRESAITKLDNRNKPAKRYEAVECEAIGQSTLVKLARRWLEKQLPEPLEDVLAREEEQREEVAALLEEHAL